MEKAIQFSNNEKSLIWNRFIKPANGTQEEAEHFLEVCENFGLNPLLGDIVFQRYETKRGAKTQFITTRDGLLRVATRQPGYVGPPNANVVKEGDHFEFLPSEGTVRHQFGTKRGKILGAYAIMQHKTHHPVAVFVDFEEYFQANSGRQNSRYGNPNVWDTLPSAMIVKIAETFVLRRQFPLGGLHTQEEIGLDEDMPTEGAGQTPQKQQASEILQPAKEVQQEAEQSEPETLTNEVAIKSFDIKTTSSEKKYGLLMVQSKESEKKFQVLVKDEQLMESLKQVTEGEILELELYEENSFYFLKNYAKTISNQEDEDENAEVSQTGQPSDQPDDPAQESESEQQEPSAQTESGNAYNVFIQNVTIGEKASEKFAKIAGVIDGKNQLILARGNEAVQKAERLEQGADASLILKKENGFLFLVDVVQPAEKAG
ncbi:RecT family recombinase [Virgibacillus sediminis]|uniref:RecT family recombinase n=1 Tax=Virgibacillus sediminis TaxID=202260 RepID=A0ABV7A3V9_9BACI